MGKSQQPLMQAPVEDVESIPYAFDSPESSTITAATYDPDTQTLRVTFRHDDSTYSYGAFPQTLWLEFLDSTSRGKFFATRIRPLFSGVREG